MAKSRFEYVRNFEIPDPLLPNTFIVVRVDGRGFHKFSDIHGFAKPNDVPALDLMNRAARAVMDDLPDVVLAFGESDEYSFLIRRTSNLYNRRRSKINSTICSLFTSAYVFYWSQYLPERPLKCPPTFDSRVVLYPSQKEIRDYFSWRQADTHINNLYNTCFWALVQSGMTTTETNKALQGTDSKAKNELLFTRFGINYNNLPPMFRKGSVLVRTEHAVEVRSNQPGPSVPVTVTVLPTSPIMANIDIEPDAEDRSVAADPIAAGSEPSQEFHNGQAVASESIMSDARSSVKRKKEAKKRPYEGITGQLVILHEDIIGDRFWTDRPWLLS